MLLLLFYTATVTAEHIINEFSSRYGYIGPACAVEEGQLFLHGVLSRNLSENEADEFKKYQHQLQTFKRLSENRQIADAPVIPPFCGSLDDSTEIVLKNCIVRNLHVYVGETLLRPLSNQERQKILATINRRSSRAFMARSMFLQRFRNDPQRRAKRELQSTSENISDLIHRYLKINSSITARFLPVVGQSAIFSPPHEWDPIAKKPISAPGSSDELLALRKLTDSATPIPPETTTPSTKSTTREYLKTLIPQRPTRSRPITEMTTPFEPIRRFGHHSRKAPTRWDLINANAELSQYSAKIKKENKSSAETVNDPTILSIISRALSHNDPSILREIGKNSLKSGLPQGAINEEQKLQSSTLPTVSQQNLSLNPLRAGTRTVIGGKAYIAVPIDRFAVDSFEEMTTTTRSKVSPTEPNTTSSSTIVTTTSTEKSQPSKKAIRRSEGLRKFPSNLDFELPDEICMAHLRISAKRK